MRPLASPLRGLEMQAGSGRDKRDVSLSHRCLHYHYLPLLERSPKSSVLHTPRCAASTTHPRSEGLNHGSPGPWTLLICVFSTRSRVICHFVFSNLFFSLTLSPQGCIPLQGSQVNELSANQDEPSRHLFEIVPGELEWRQFCYVKAWPSTLGLGQVRTKHGFEKYAYDHDDIINKFTYKKFTIFIIF